MASVGYTQKQADDLVLKIDRQAEKACAEVEKLFKIITDQGLSSSSVIDELLFRASILKDIVRRRRKP